VLLTLGDSHTNLVQPTIVSEDGNVSIVCAGCLIVLARMPWIGLMLHSIPDIVEDLWYLTVRYWVELEAEAQEELDKF
jgi:hypothetical protein